ncbi:hypothetical protein M8C21_001387, partial [Ambrosia artemisiifolia]
SQTHIHNIDLLIPTNNKRAEDLSHQTSEDDVEMDLEDSQIWESKKIRRNMRVSKKNNGFF